MKLIIEAEDNGLGFYVTSGVGEGLENIQSRTAFLGGCLHVDSSAGGTTIIIKLPYK